MPDTFSLERKTALFSQSTVFKGISMDAIRCLGQMTGSERYAKNDIVFQPEEPCNAFMLVADGLIRVSRFSALGKRITYLLAGPGDPINLVGPFTGAPRAYIAEAVVDSSAVKIRRKDFTAFAFSHPQLITNIIEILGQAVDSSNSRILDMVEKNVIQRLIRSLHTLFKKFGSTLNFTAEEIAELTGTTTESSLRVLSTLRRNGIIEKTRGKIRILNPDALLDIESDDLWI